GLRGHADPVLRQLCWRFHWCGAVRVGRMSRLFRRDRVRRLVLAGKVHKADLLYHPWRVFQLLPDWRTFRAFYFRRRRDNRDDTLLLGLVSEFAQDGLTVESALELCPELLVKPGV